METRYAKWLVYEMSVSRCSIWGIWGFETQIEAENFAVNKGSNFVVKPAGEIHFSLGVA